MDVQVAEQDDREPDGLGVTGDAASRRGVPSESSPGERPREADRSLEILRL